MPPHLHPRSRLTSSLFATTLFASFFVVALPHALPCPAPRVAYADGEVSPDGRRRRRRKIVVVEDGEDQEDGNGDQSRNCSKGVNASVRRERDGIARNRGMGVADVEEEVEGGRASGSGAELESEGSTDELRILRGKRECPVPKPSGMVGEILGFRKVKNLEREDFVAGRSSNGKGERPP